MPKKPTTLEVSWFLVLIEYPLSMSHSQNVFLNASLLKKPFQQQFWTNHSTSLRGFSRVGWKLLGTVILEYFKWKNTNFLILPSSLSRYSSAPKTERIFQMPRCIFEGCTNRIGPSQPFLKNCRNGPFKPMHVIQKFLGPNYFLWKCYQVALFKKCLRLRPSAKTADKRE